MQADAATPETEEQSVDPEHGTVAETPAQGRGWRRWALRVFVLTMLIAGAGTVAVAAVDIVSGKDKAAANREPEFGVLMPQADRYKAEVNELLKRKRPRQLHGLTVVGDAGKVEVLKARRGKPSFPSSYLNPNALSVLARAIGVRSDTLITVAQLRLEVLERTGRLRWRLQGEQGGRPWRAVIAPNGTNLKLIGAKAA